MQIPDEVIWEICRNIRTDPGHEGMCNKCPRKVETSYGAGTQMCRMMAENAYGIAAAHVRSTLHIQPAPNAHKRIHD